MIDNAQYAQPTLVGDSPAIQDLRETIRNAANVDVPVLITGESGTGKGVVAQLLHELSGRRHARFVKTNCPAIPGQLFESELFGIEPGAFTGANKARAGVFEQADGGSLFLDEIGELDPAVQSKLLQVLQDFKITRLGATTDRLVDVRLICATNRNLSVDVDHQRFRADLFYRINVIHIEVPSLRQRASDVHLLITHYLQVYGDKFGHKPKPLSASLMKVLEAYHWPGNIRELENLMKRYVILEDEQTIVSALRHMEDIHHPSIDEAVDIHTPLRIQTKRVTQTLERRIIMNVLQANCWNRRKTARSLDISYRALLYKIKEAGMPSIRTVHSSKNETDAK